MASRGGGAKKEMDPEVLMKIKFRAKCQFRALGRLVMANKYWLIEGIDQYEGVDDVKRRVQQAVRKKKKQLLTIADKALLNKEASERTDLEKKYLYRIIGGLKCFKRYPNYVKKQLAAHTYFKYYGPGRVIVRQHQEAHALYFIVTGEVVVSQMIWDGLLQDYVSVDVGTMQQGDMFGEVSLLHNIPRTATCTTIGHCELLVLLKEDFKSILQESIQEKWDEVRAAMSSFTYFESFDEVALREGCIVAKMKSFEENQTLLGDGVGVANYVYFVLSGKCQMIESIQVLVTMIGDRKFYTLFDPYEEPIESEQDLDKYFAAYNLSKSKTSYGSSESQSRSKTETHDNQEQDINKKEFLPSTKAESVSFLKRSSLRTGSGLKTMSVQIVSDVKDLSLDGNIKEVKSQERVRQRYSSQRSSQAISEGEVILSPSQAARESIRLSVVPEIAEERPQNLRTYFMQVCQFNPGATFGFGENMRDRRIIALTPVQCMLMPKMWLLQRNTANIWTRIQYYLNKKIPTKKQLFKEFVKERRWRENRDKVVEDVIARTDRFNWTTVHDVPYSRRLEEMLDI